MSYSTTGNTQYTGVTQAQSAQFSASLPREFQGVPTLVVTSSGNDVMPTTPVIVAVGGTSNSFSFDSQTYLLAGSGSKLDLSPSHASNGSTVPVNVQLSGNDTITLNTGNDYVNDTAGGNTITTNGGGDTIASFGHNLISVMGDLNIIAGNTGDTINLGSSINNAVYAGSQAETISGGIDSYIFGGGHSSITGGVNNQVSLVGHDTLAAGPGGAYGDSVNVAGGSHVVIREVHSQDMDITVNKSEEAQKGSDTIFGGNNTIVHVQDLGGIKASEQHGRLTEIQFNSGDKLFVHNVTLDLGSGSSKTV